MEQGTCNWKFSLQTGYERPLSQPNLFLHIPVPNLLPLDSSINFSAVSTKSWELLLCFKCLYWFSCHCDPVAAFNTCFNFGGEVHTVRLHTHFAINVFKIQDQAKIALTFQNKPWFYTWQKKILKIHSTYAILIYFPSCKTGQMLWVRPARSHCCVSSCRVLVRWGSSCEGGWRDQFVSWLNQTNEKKTGD